MKLWLYLGGLACTSLVLWYSGFNDTETVIPSWLKLCLALLAAPMLTKLCIQLISIALSSWPKSVRERVFPQPNVSVLIAAFNEEVGIVRTLQSIVDNGYDNLEIVVINDGSTDNTDTEISNWLVQHNQLDTGIAIIYDRLQNGGKAKALNHALTYASGEIVITIDADSIVTPGSIEAMVAPFKSPTVGAVAGNIIVDKRKTLLSWVQQLEYLIGFTLKRADSMWGCVHIIGGAAAAYRMSIIRKVGNFDDQLITEDIDMSFKILSAGYKTRFAPNAVVVTEAPAKVSCLRKQRLRWKYGRLQTLAKHSELFFNRSKGLSPYLTHFLLPLSIFAEMALIIQWPLMVCTFFFLISSLQFHELAIATLTIGTIFSMMVILFGSKAHHRRLITLAPHAWLVMPFIDFIESIALVSSLIKLAAKKPVKWQSWSRTGLSKN